MDVEDEDREIDVTDIRGVGSTELESARVVVFTLQNNMNVSLAHDRVFRLF